MVSLLSFLLSLFLLNSSFLISSEDRDQKPQFIIEIVGKKDGALHVSKSESAESFESARNSVLKYAEEKRYGSAFQQCQIMFDLAIEQKSNAWVAAYFETAQQLIVDAKTTDIGKKLIEKWILRFQANLRKIYNYRVNDADHVRAMRTFVEEIRRNDFSEQCIESFPDIRVLSFLLEEQQIDQFLSEEEAQKKRAEIFNNVRMLAQGGKSRHACVALSRLYQHGIGVGKNEIQAFLWLEKGLEGWENIKSNNEVIDRAWLIGLGTYYQKGHGTLKNYSLARQLYQKGLELGSISASIALVDLETCEQAEKMAALFAPAEKEFVALRIAWGNYQEGDLINTAKLTERMLNLVNLYERLLKKTNEHDENRFKALYQQGVLADYITRISPQFTKDQKNKLPEDYFKDIVARSQSLNPACVTQVIKDAIGGAHYKLYQKLQREDALSEQARIHLTISANNYDHYKAGYFIGRELLQQDDRSKMGIAFLRRAYEKGSLRGNIALMRAYENCKSEKNDSKKMAIIDDWRKNISSRVRAHQLWIASQRKLRKGLEEESQEYAHLAAQLGDKSAAEACIESCLQKMPLTEENKRVLSSVVNAPCYENNSKFVYIAQLLSSVDSDSYLTVYCKEKQQKTKITDREYCYKIGELLREKNEIDKALVWYQRGADKEDEKCIQRSALISLKKGDLPTACSFWQKIATTNPQAAANLSLSWLCTQKPKGYTLEKIKLLINSHQNNSYEPLIKLKEALKNTANASDAYAYYLYGPPNKEAGSEFRSALIGNRSLV